MNEKHIYQYIEGLESIEEKLERIATLLEEMLPGMAATMLMMKQGSDKSNSTEERVSDLFEITCQDNMLSRKEASIRSGVCLATIDRHIREGKLKAFRPSPRRIVIPKSAFEEWMKKGFGNSGYQNARVPITKGR